MTKKHDINIIMGDFNAKVGKEETTNVTGKFGLGDRNERENRLVQFCQEEEFIIGNTYYKLSERRLYTWKSPQDGMRNIIRNQIDYILINKRFKSSMIRAKTLPGADVPSDHNLLLATIRSRLTSRKTKQKKSHIDIQKLENDYIRNDFQNKLNELLTSCNTGENPIEWWNNTADKIRILTTNTLGTRINVAKEKWMNDEILNLMNERRKYRNINIDEYKRRNKEIRDKIRDARNQWMGKQCEDIERLEKLHDSFNLHRKLKEICNLRRYNTINTLYDTNDKVITDENEKRNIWVQYVHELFKDDSRDWSDSTTNNSSSIKQQHRSCNNQAIKTAARELRVTNNSSSIKQQHRSCNNQAIKTAARELRVTNNSSSIKQQHRSCNNQAIKTAARELRVTNFIKKFFLVLVESFSTCEYFILQQIILNNNNQNQVSETRESDCVENFS
ncbi:uncharacterized protein LOC129244320 [Anastrepha obliqua]|uniref:uncharacterized protein LOC129244320 n=1 Tax=Anastrepha obliqua TaxID=95512 RepID=UPI002409394C|nr:uncharacterized protein LOC129244320 [Anastrepha obliqua]